MYNRNARSNSDTINVGVHEWDLLQRAPWLAVYFLMGTIFCLQTICLDNGMEDKRCISCRDGFHFTRSPWQISSSLKWNGLLSHNCFQLTSSTSTNFNYCWAPSIAPPNYAYNILSWVFWLNLASHYYCLMLGLLYLVKDLAILTIVAIYNINSQLQIVSRIIKMLSEVYSEFSIYTKGSTMPLQKTLFQKQHC